MSWAQQIKSLTFVFFGYGSEYSLGPLCEHFRQHGFKCLEIDLLASDNPDKHLRDLVGKPIVFLTSAHPLYDERNFTFYRADRKVVSALHVISTLKPIVSVYYPHDYKDPIKEEELAYLSLFDLLLWPFESAPARYMQKTEVACVGWIKYVERGLVERPIPKREAVFFLGAYQYYLRAGIDRLVEDFSDLLHSGVAIKLPRWHDNESVESYLRQSGADVIASNENSIEVIENSELVIAHALSSVAVEACHLGKRVVYIRDPRFDYKDPILEFRDAGKIAFVDSPQTAASFHRGEAPANQRSMLAFNFHDAQDAIIAAAKAKGAI